MIRWMRIKIRNKMLLSYIFLFVLCAVCMIQICNYFFRSFYLKSLQEQVSFSTRQTSRNADMYFEEVTRVTDSLAFSPMLENYFNAINAQTISEDEQAQLRSEILQYIGAVVKSSTNIKNVTIVSLEGEYLIWDMGLHTVQAERFSEIFQAVDTFSRKARESNQTRIWYYNKEERQHFYYQELYSMQTLYPIGQMLVELNGYYLTDIFRQISANRYASFFVVDQGNQVLASHVVEEDLIDADGTLSLLEKYKAPENILSYECRYVPYRIIAVISEQLLLNDSNVINIYLYLILVIGIFIVGILFFVTSRSLTKPLQILIETMQKTGPENLHLRVEVPSKDEFGDVAFYYNQLLDRIEILVEEVSTQERLLHEMELKALYAQINPHFFCNTLEAVNCLVDLGQNEQVKTTIHSLSRLMHMSVQKSENFIPISWEKEYIECYLNIQQIRFGNRLNYQINIEKNILQYKIPKLILQPIVENAVIYSVEKKRETGIVSLEGHLENGYIVFRVSDNGIGMDAQIIKKIMSEEYIEASGNSHGIALLNITKRIRFIYGASYSPVIRTALGKGTEVTITLPIL